MHRSIYIYDIDAQVNYRLDLNDTFNVPFVQMLTRLISQHNHYVVNSIPKLEQLQIQNTQRYEIRIQSIQHNDRRYDLSTEGELTAINLYGSLENEVTSEHRDILP